MFHAAAAITIVNAAVSTGFSIAALATSPGVISGYGADRSVALLVATGAVVVLRRTVPLVVLGRTLAAVQIMDAVIGFAAQDVAKGVGPVVLAVLTAGAIVRLQRGVRR